MRPRRLCLTTEENPGCILVSTIFVRGLCIATGHYSSLCVSAVVLFLGGFDHMEVDEQDREQVDSERESRGARERERRR